MLFSRPLLIALPSQNATKMLEHLEHSGSEESIYFKSFISLIYYSASLLLRKDLNIALLKPLTCSYASAHVLKIPDFLPFATA